MLNKSYISASTALQRVLSQLPSPEHILAHIPVEEIPIEDAYNRIIAEDVYATEDLPGFARSTVDGYAVIAEDTFGAKETSPVCLTVKGEVFMGMPADMVIVRGECAKIPTGGMLPLGADAVLMFEHAQTISENMIEAIRTLSRNDNVIQADEDIKAGELVLQRGSKIRSQDAGAMAGIGHTIVRVYKKPNVSIISTGDEIVPASNPVKKGQVRDINSFTLSGLINQCGGVAIKQGIYNDDYAVLKEVFYRALKETDMVLISGGTSAGIKDMTSRIIQDAGSPGVLFHGVSIKPGKPLIGAVVNGKPVFGLPGHPAAIFVSFYSFIKPVLKRLSGCLLEMDIERTVKAVMCKNISSTAGREDHVRVCLKRSPEGLLTAEPVLGKSGLITTLVKADGIVIIESERLGINAGEEVIVRLF